MNSERLLEAFNRLGDEPETVQQIRKLVIGLAMSGKLVAPDEVVIDPASLFKQIEEKKVLLIQQGVLRKPPPMAALSHEDLPQGFNNPANFVRVGSIARIEKGLTGIMKAERGPYPLVVTAEDRASCDHFDFDGAAAIVPLVSSAGHGKASLQRLHYQEGKFALGSILAAIFPHAPELISARFLFEYLTSFKDELLVSKMIGTANVSLSVGKVSDVPVPLVSPSVQRKVDELMGLCDRLEEGRGSREGLRDRLAAVSFARLNAPDPETFQADARFALDVLAALTTRPDQIKALRQTILNLAVRGKLAPQDANDGPASELLKRIANEIAAYGKANRVGQAQAEPITHSDLPFSAPNGWQWTRLCALFKVITDGDHQPPPKTDEGVAFLTIGNITTGRLDFTGCRLVPEAYFKSLAPYRTPAKDDILYTVVGATYGRPALVETDRDFCVQRHIAILKPVEAMSLRFLIILLASPLIYEQATRSTTGTAQPTIALRPLRNFLAPLPPLAEQHRIVAKVDALMALCDRLEASLTTTATTRRRLLDALLAEALAPTEDREMEAAE